MQRQKSLRKKVDKSMAYFTKQVELLGEGKPNKLDASIEAMNEAIKRSEDWNNRIVGMDTIAKIALEDGNAT